MCRGPDPDLVDSLKSYLKKKQPDQTEEILVKMAEHLAHLVQDELDNFE
jgi:hypothetical protein